LVPTRHASVKKEQQLMAIQVFSMQKQWEDYMYTAVHPNMVECYFLRLLLVNVVGPRSFEDMQTVNGHLSVTYREACEHLCLLENDAHWDSSLHDASIASSPHQIRMLYAIIISTCFPSNPIEL